MGEENKGEENKRVVIDLDGVICKPKKEHQEYSELEPDFEIIDKLKEYKAQGFYIIIYSARNMRTFKGNHGKLNAVTLKTIFSWLDKHHVPYDEIFIGKPWCGFEGFYVDDKAIRPYEFLNLSFGTISEIIKNKNNENGKEPDFDSFNKTRM